MYKYCYRDNSTSFNSKTIPLRVSVVCPTLGAKRHKKEEQNVLIDAFFYIFCDSIVIFPDK